MPQSRVRCETFQYVLDHSERQANRTHPQSDADAPRNSTAPRRYINWGSEKITRDEIVCLCVCECHCRLLLYSTWIALSMTVQVILGTDALIIAISPAATYTDRHRPPTVTATAHQADVTVIDGSISTKQHISRSDLIQTSTDIMQQHLWQQPPTCRYTAGRCVLKIEMNCQSSLYDTIRYDTIVCI